MKIKLFLTNITVLFFINSMFALDYDSKNSFNDQNISIKILTKEIKPGQVFRVKVNDVANMDEKAWLGIFKPNLNPKDPSGYDSYVYIKDYNTNKVEMTAPLQRGEYELRLYAADPGEFIKSIKFNVKSIQPNQYKVTILTNKIKPSQEFKVNITTTYEMDSRSWLGIFKSDSDPSSPKGYSSYVYMTKPYNEDITLTPPNEPGDYELRFYSADPGELIVQIPFRIGNPNLPGIAYTLNKKAYDPEEEIIVNYIGHNNLAESAWIGLFKVGSKVKKYNNFLDYYYLAPKQKGQFKFKAPSTKGEYQVRMFYAETGPELLAPISFSVTSSLNDIKIKETLNKNGKITLYGIYFNTDKSNIKRESYPLIKEIAKMLNTDTSIKVRIEGHTDSQGDDKYNQNLSQKRAEAVVQILISEYNVKKIQLEAIGYGETKPVDKNNTLEGRAKNRRVELKKI